MRTTANRTGNNEKKMEIMQDQYHTFFLLTAEAMILMSTPRGTHRHLTAGVARPAPTHLWATPLPHLAAEEEPASTGVRCRVAVAPPLQHLVAANRFPQARTTRVTPISLLTPLATGQSLLSSMMAMVTSGNL